MQRQQTTMWMVVCFVIIPSMLMMVSGKPDEKSPKPYKKVFRWSAVKLSDTKGDEVRASL